MSKDYYSPQMEALDSAMSKLIKENSFGLLFDFRKIMAPRKISDSWWARISTSGQLNLCSYGVELHNVTLRCVEIGHLDSPNTFEVRFSIGTADDGSWGACSKQFSTKEEAEALVLKMVPILNDLTVLPSESDLNEMLRPFGLFGEFEP